MTAVLEDLRVLPDIAVADVYSEAEDEMGAAALAELARRDQADRLARARATLAAIRAEGEQAAYAQYLRAEEWTRGRLLSRAGMAAGIRETDLWRLPADRADRLGSEEYRDFHLYMEPRITAADYVRQHAAEARVARMEARELGETGDLAADDDETEEVGTDDGHDEYGGPGLARDEAGSLRRELAASEGPQDGGGAGPVRRGGRSSAEECAGQPSEAGARRPAVAPRGVSTVATAYTAYDAIEPLATEYLLGGYPKIPRGDVTLVFGEGSAGKGRMICSFIAEVVNAGGTVLTVQPEDHPHEEVAPRLRGAGVQDLSKVLDLTRLPGGSRLKLSADMKHDGDVGLIRQAVEELNEAGHKVRLLVIDPLAACVGWGSISTNAGARRLVEPLQDLAMSTGIAVIVVAHTVKSGVLQGSAGLSQALRLVYRVSKDPANPLLRVLHAEKANNIVAEDLRFTIEAGDDGQVRVVWLDRTEQDKRNMSWRTPAPVGSGAETAAAVPQIADTRAAAPARYAALLSTQRAWEARPSVQVLASYPDPEKGAELARRRCELHPMFSGARWEPGEAGELLARFVTNDGVTIRFAVAAMREG